MPPARKVVGAGKRAITAGLRFAFRLIRLLFILALVALPVPVATLIVEILRPTRRNLPAEILRKK